MRRDVAVALTKSSEAFHDIVWPIVSPSLGGGELIPVESVTETDFAKTLDTEAGVDAWQVSTGAGMRPLASRVQTNSPRHDTFTIRYETKSGSRTEIDKRIDAIRDGWLYPSVTVQAYLDCPLRDPDSIGFQECRCRSWLDHPLISVAWIDTVVLYEFASMWRSKHALPDDYWKARDGAYVKDVGGGNRMLVVPWRLLPDTSTLEAAA